MSSLFADLAITHFILNQATMISCWRKVIRDTWGSPLYRLYSMYISPVALKGIKWFFVLQQLGDNLQIPVD